MLIGIAWNPQLGRGEFTAYPFLSLPVHEHGAWLYLGLFLFLSPVFYSFTIQILHIFY